MSEMTYRERVLTSLRHEEPDRLPVDLLATKEVWDRLIEALQPDTSGMEDMTWMEPEREAVMRMLEVDCRLFSYDMFINPPESVIKPGAVVDPWATYNRSTPNKMWRQVMPDGTLYDIWGIHGQVEHSMFGSYEGFASWPLSEATSVDELKNHPWPTPDYWDFSPLPGMLDRLDRDGDWHIRFRLGSFFELAWQLRGLAEMMMDFIENPAIPEYLMDRLLEVHLANLETVLELAGDRLDMIYTYDDVATQNSLMISPKMWRQYVKPRHQQIIDLCKKYNKPVMYHCDGAIYPLIPDLIEMGVDLLNPIQPDAKDMESARLKEEFGDQISFHGGLDIIQVLPRGTREEVIAETKRQAAVLGKGGGYILCSSHHIQPDTPVENVLAMYELDLRKL